ncbi:UDP-N-acetylmuramoyl-L-alanyl-D-glutamate--2,6-diaminopimelate ligase [Chloroflexota bacterium]
MAESLTRLVANLPNAESQGSTDIDIQGITCDSRQVVPGFLFVAYRGVMVDGHDYIPHALAQGAVAFVVETVPDTQPSRVPVVRVPDGREALAYLSAAWHGLPSHRLTVIGVTGTDGKTTTCNLIHSILTAAGRRAGLVTTVNAVIGDRVMDTGLHTTTPDAPDVQRHLAEMAAASPGVEVAVLEATSHGLQQYRVAACDFDVAVVTNVTHEHLDIHGSLEVYQQAKATLFRLLAAGYRKPGVPKVSVLNANDDSHRYLSAIPADRHLAYSIGGRADVVATDVRRVGSGDETRFSVHSPAADFELRTLLAGDFNVSNILAATSVALALDVPVDAIQRGVWDVKGIIGRMERVDEGQDFLAIVDFAHTPNALQRALETARSLTSGRVIAVFGSAGERDVAKRAWMGEIGGRLADIVILTAEDPRSEPLEMILDEMAQGTKQAGGIEGETYFRVADRTEAIQYAVNLALPGDAVIALGKGHEQSMCFGTVETPWNEHEVLRTALRRRLSPAGP